MYRILTTVILLCISLEAIAQEAIQLDRPDQTETPAIVPKNYLQFESGFLYEKENLTNYSMQIPSVLWKYGISDKTELRLITELEYEVNQQTHQLKLQPLALGFKTALLEEHSWIPKTSFIGHLEVFGRNSEENYVAVPSFRFVFQNTLSEDLNLGYNLGMIWDTDMQETYLYTITLGKSLHPKLGVYAEVYGFLTPNKIADHRVDGGFTYLINNDFMIDFSAGVGLSRISPQYYFAFGISHRFNLK